jgi:crossover junction endodeoxyribonuclease RusA
MTLRFDLPWPPSVNTYWRHTVRNGKKPGDPGGRLKKAHAHVYISEQGEKYRRDVFYLVRSQKVPRGALKGRLAVHAIAYPPDARTRDLDNCWKGLLDALKAAGVIVDDGDIDDLHIVRGPKRAGGLMRLEVREIGEYHDQAALDLGATILDRDPF